MTTYHIDPLNGSDSNNGTSWGTAFKTFFPLASRAVTPGPGDLVKVAKTPAPVAMSALLASATLAMSTTDGLTGWTNGRSTSYAFPDIQGHVRPLVRGVDTELWTAVSASFSYTAVNFSTWALPRAGRSYLTISDLATSELACYFAFAATVDLSSYGRIEMPIVWSVNNTSDTEDWPAVSLRLCSDSAGNTPLLTIPITAADRERGLLAYEGALPAGVNSASLYLDTPTRSTVLYVGSLIATKPYSDANYYGYLCRFRLGVHEGSFFVAPDTYLYSAGSAYVYLSTSLVGPASVHNTNIPIYTRKAVVLGCAGRPATDKMYSYDLHTYAYGGLWNAERSFGFLRDRGVYPAFDLTGIAGTLAQPFVIEGGYNTGTDTVDGETFIASPEMGTYGTTGLLWVDGTQHVTVKNIDTFQWFGGYMWARGVSSNLKFQACELVGQPTAFEGPGVPTAAVYDNGINWQYNGLPWTLTNVQYTNCFGSLIAYTKLAAASASTSGFEYIDCILAPYSVRTYRPAAPVKASGTLKVYGQGTTALHLPPFENAQSLTVQTHAAHYAYVYHAAPGVYAGTHQAPSFDMKNGTLSFTSKETLDGSAYSGEPTAIVVPSIALTYQSSAWVTTPSATTGLLAGADVGAPPIRVDSFTASGSRYGSSIVGLVTSLDTSFQFSDLDVQANWSLGIDRTYTPSTTEKKACPPVLIVDGASVGTQSDPPLRTVRGWTEVRSMTWTAGDSGSYIDGSTVMSGVARFVDCILNPYAGTSLVMYHPTWLTDTPSLPVPSVGVVFENTTATLASTLTATQTSNMLERMLAPRITAAGTVYDFLSTLGTDASVYLDSAPSWKSTLRRQVATYYLNMRPLGSLPVKSGTHVAVTLNTRRGATTNNEVALIVEHDGAAGYTVATDFREKVAKNTAAANTWQTVTVEFDVVRDGYIDLYVAHWGASAAVAWYDDIKVIEA